MNLYGTKKIKLPVPDCYVIYTGEGIERPSSLSLAEEFFGEKIPLDLRARVLSAPDTKTIVGQYIYFCHVFNEQTRIHGRNQKAIEETIHICQGASVLTEYLEERAREVRNIMMTLFDQEEVTKRYGNEMKEEGRMEGRMEGLMEGLMEGASIAMEAMRMLKENIPLDVICQKTKLSAQNLRELQSLL